jgi:type III secretion protein L
MNAPLGRILRAQDVRLYQDAASALRIAQDDAEALRSAALRDAEVIRADCLAKAREEQNRQSIHVLATAEAEARRCLSALPAEIAIAIAEGVAKVIGSLDLSEAVARAAQKAMTELTDRHTITVRVNPLAEDHTRAALQGEPARVIADPALDPDACILETQTGFVRAGLNEQIAALRHALLEAGGRP